MVTVQPRVGEVAVVVGAEQGPSCRGQSTHPQPRASHDGVPTQSGCSVAAGEAAAPVAGDQRVGLGGGGDPPAAALTQDGPGPVEHGRDQVGLGREPQDLLHRDGCSVGGGAVSEAGRGGLPRSTVMMTVAGVPPLSGSPPVPAAAGRTRPPPRRASAGPVVRSSTLRNRQGQLVPVR